MSASGYKGIVSERQSATSNKTQASKFAAALELAENAESEEFSTLEDFRHSTRKFMSKSRFGFYYENILLLVSVASSIEFICFTYLEDHFETDHIYRAKIVELFFVALFTADWCLNFFLADQKMVFLPR
jgi:hypothetical protein